MKKILLIIALFLTVLSCNAQTKITPEQAKDNIGKNVQVCGKVYNVYTSKKGNTFLNFGGKYPNQAFAATIFASDKNNFKTLDYANKEICVTGYIKEYNGKPEIIVKYESQISGK